MTPSVSLIAVGDELLLGRTVDTNTAWLARWATDRGLRVTGARIIGDDEVALTAAIVDATTGTDLVLMTGGLGPTLDDRTRHALAAAAGVSLVERQQAWNQIQRWYAKAKPGAEIPASNRRQALVPRGGQILANDRGTAPGLLVPVGKAWVVALPGVPHEMMAMVGRLDARLPDLLPGLVPPHIAEVHVAGLGESRCQDLLGDLLAPEAGLGVGITAHEVGHITVRAWGPKAAVVKRCRGVRKVLRGWALPEPGLAESLVARLSHKQMTVTAAESCTCGGVLAAIGAVPGASAVLKEGVVTYHNKRKRQRLGVPEEILEMHGAVSEECAAHMAAGARSRAGASIAISTTGIAGPTGGTKVKPVGTVWVAVASSRGVSTRLLQVQGDRARIQRRAVAGALLLAWEHLGGYRARPLALTC